jgi:hypothetical protein
LGSTSAISSILLTVPFEVGDTRNFRTLVEEN